MICLGLIGRRVGAALTALVLLAFPLSGAAQPARLGIYYGWPSRVNDAQGDPAAALEAFQGFDLLVLGDGLQRAAHPDRGPSIPIISALVGAGVEVFGYVDMGVTTQGLTVARARDAVQTWAQAGVTGIFWDDAGAEYGVHADRLHALIDFTHALGLTAFVNAWVPAEVLSPRDGRPTPLRAGDLYLAESHPIPLTALDTWWERSVSLDQWRRSLGIRVAAIATGPVDHAGWPNSPNYRQALWAARMFGWDAFGYAPQDYGAASSRLPRAPKLATDPGADFLAPPRRLDATHWQRLTTRGAISIQGGDGFGSGTLTRPSCAASPDFVSPDGRRSPPALLRGLAPDPSLPTGWHRGIDLAIPPGRIVRAAADAIVHEVIRAQDGTATLRLQLGAKPPYRYLTYGALADVSLAPGDLVTACDPLGIAVRAHLDHPGLHLQLTQGCPQARCAQPIAPLLGLAPRPAVPPRLVGARRTASESPSRPLPNDPRQASADPQRALRASATSPSHTGPSHTGPSHSLTRDRDGVLVTADAAADGGSPGWPRATVDPAPPVYPWCERVTVARCSEPARTASRAGGAETQRTPSARPTLSP